MLPHPVSAFEETRVKQRTRYLIIAVLLTILDGVVNGSYGVAILRAWSRDIWVCGVLVLFAAVGVTSLANVWAHPWGAVHGLKAPGEADV